MNKALHNFQPHEEKTRYFVCQKLPTALCLGTNGIFKRQIDCYINHKLFDSAALALAEGVSVSTQAPRVV